MSELDRVVFTLAPSPARRWAAVIVLSATGLLLIWVALNAPQSAPLWQVALLGAGAAALWGARRLWLATEHQLELTEHSLRSSDGTVLCRIDGIKSVDRGAFAFKPSNGFLLTLVEPAGPRRWAPGLWWRTGRRIGIGGVTPGAQGRVMADMIAVELAQRGR